MKIIDCTKLPQWAQQHIAQLQRQRDTAVLKLNQYCDSQTVSPIYTEELECIGEKEGPSTLRRYLQACNVHFEWGGVHLTVAVPSCDPRERSIRLRWEGASSKNGTNEVAMIPESFQSVRLKAKEKMR